MTPDSALGSIVHPLKWPGGKSYLAKRIVALFPPRCKTPNDPAPDDPGYLHYVEPYAGGLAVLLENDPNGISEVINDTNGDLTNFWLTLQQEFCFKRFQRLCEATPFSEYEFRRAEEYINEHGEGKSQSGDRWTHAHAFFVYCRQSLAGRLDTFAPLSRNRTRRGMNEQASAWLGAIDGLPAVHARLRPVVILNEDAPKVIRKQDGKRTLFYIDPTYPHDVRETTTEYGEHEMTDEQHETLLILLAGIEGRFLLSCYHCPMYDEAAFDHKWTCHEFKIPNNAAGGKKKRRMTEVVWTNY